MDADMAREIEILKQKIENLEQLSKGQGLRGLFHFKHPHITEAEKAKHSWSSMRPSRPWILTERFIISWLKFNISDRGF